MTTKWASYSTTGRLTFDASLLGLRAEIQDYVIAHELLHSHVPNHGRLWKSLMRVHLGEYEQLERELRRGPRVVGQASVVVRANASVPDDGRSVLAKPATPDLLARNRRVKGNETD
jgi:hypothetical protein